MPGGEVRPKGGSLSQRAPDPRGHTRFSPQSATSSQAANSPGLSGNKVRTASPKTFENEAKKRKKCIGVSLEIFWKFVSFKIAIQEFGKWSKMTGNDKKNMPAGKH